MADDRRDEANYDWEFSSSEFSARERRRLRKLVRDDDNATYLHKVILKWAAIVGSIITSVLLAKDTIKLWLKWVFGAQ